MCLESIIKLGKSFQHKSHHKLLPFDNNIFIDIHSLVVRKLSSCALIESVTGKLCTSRQKGTVKNRQFTIIWQTLVYIADPINLQEKMARDPQVHFVGKPYSLKHHSEPMFSNLLKKSSFHLCTQELVIQTLHTSENTEYMTKR